MVSKGRSNAKQNRHKTLKELQKLKATSKQSSTSAKAQVPSFHTQQKRHQHTSLARQLLPLFSRHTTTHTALAQTKTDTQSKESTTTTTTTTTQHSSGSSRNRTQRTALAGAHLSF
jgi:hypothetical protein